MAPTFPPYAAMCIDAFFTRPEYRALASGSDDDRRKLTEAIIAQLVFTDPAFGWCWKSADPGRPASKDALACQRDGRLYAWDWQSGDTRLRQVQAGQPAEDITGQNAIPVSAVDSLGDTPQPQNTDLQAKVKLLQDIVTSQGQAITHLVELTTSLHDSLQLVVEELSKDGADIKRIDEYLASHAIPTGVQVAARLYGITIPVSAKLTY